MKKEFFTYLKSYSTETNDVNRLIVSAFLYSLKIDVSCNKMLREILIKKGDDDYEKLLEFLTLHTFSNIEELIQAFEFVVSPSEKEINGAVYTPKHIRDYIVKRSLDKLEEKDKFLDNAKISDIACGCGGFFFTLTEELKKRTGKLCSEIYRDNIYGLDIQEYSITRAKILLTLLAVNYGEDIEEFSFNLYTGNSLDFNWKTIPQIADNNGFDLVLGNPPYVGASKLDDISLDLLTNWSVSAKGKPDLYIPFFQIGIELLTPVGILGYITMNSFLRSLNGIGIREYILENEFSFELVDFSAQQVFKGRRTYTCICIIEKEKGEGVNYAMSNHLKLPILKESSFSLIPYSKLDANKGWVLGKPNIKKIIEKIESTGSPLGNVVDIKNGLATLRNNIYVFKPFFEDDEIFKFEKNGVIYSIEKAICRDVLKPSKLKTEEEINGNMEKIIFPYNQIIEDEESHLKINNSLDITPIDESLFQNEYPHAYSYLESLKIELSKRDKGKKEYNKWYCYGRSQGLSLNGHRLFFPYMTDQPYFVYSDNQNLLFYNGFVILSDNARQLKILKKILISNIFWFYVKHVSRPYEKGYFSMGKRYIKNFGICDLTFEEEEYVLNEESDINSFFLDKYNFSKTEIKLLNIN